MMVDIMVNKKSIITIKGIQVVKMRRDSYSEERKQISSLENRT